MGASEALVIERFEGPAAPRSAVWLGAGGYEGTVYQARRGGEVLWTVGIDFGEASHVPFREELVWPAAGVVVLGGGNVVHVLDAVTGEPRKAIAIPSYFGHLALASVVTHSGTEEVLFVLGWTDVHAIGLDLEARWIARNVAVDGIVFGEVRGHEVFLSAEMDPPGGWVDMALDVRTGAETRRET